jgi:hypothetical protein
MQATVDVIAPEALTSGADIEASVVIVGDQQPATIPSDSDTNLLSRDTELADAHTKADVECADTSTTNDEADGSAANADLSGNGAPVDEPPEARNDSQAHQQGQLVGTNADGAVSADPNRDSSFEPAPREATDLTADGAEYFGHSSEHSAPILPDPTSISARLKNLVVSVSQVEELSRRAREAAASDLTLYSGIAASQRQFEHGLAEARRIGQEALSVYERAFGREAKAVAEPAVAEAREVEQAFAELADAWRNQAETFLADHPDVEALLAEQQQHTEKARRREIAHTKAERFQQLVTATDAALRQGLLDDARDCLKLLGREFPAEAARLAPLQERLDHRVRAANDAAARRTLLQASELQGRGEFDAAVRLLEAVDVQGLSREASEDVFGRWSAACSLLGQTGGLDLLRYSPTQGRGVVLHRDPSVPFGLVVFSSLGMGGNFFEGRVVSNTDREGSTIVARARPFRAADPVPELNTGWYGRSYVTSGGAPNAPVRH